MANRVEALIHTVGERTTTPFVVRFPGGGEYRNSSHPPAFTVSFNNARALRRTALFHHVGLLDSYFDGDVDIDGDLAACLAVGMEGGLDEPNLLLRLINRWHEFRHSNSSRSQARDNANFHYALGPDFYKYWLDDPLMLYTCAYWKEGTRTLEEAQRNKCEHVARKSCCSPARRWSTSAAASAASPSMPPRTSARA